MPTHIVAFLGPVGSGKSTQRDLLASDLEARGIQVRTTFLKSRHLLTYVLEVVLVKILIGRRNNSSPVKTLIEKKLNVFRSLFKILTVLDTISINIKFLLDVYIPLKRGHVVLVEEYLPAIMADYLYFRKLAGFTFGNSRFIFDSMLRLLYLGGPTHAIFLDANTKALSYRWHSRGSPNERADYVHTQRTLLLHLLETLASWGTIDLFFVDTTKMTIGETHELLVNHFDKLIKRPC